MSLDMLQIAGGWIIITIAYTVAWIIWPRQHSLRSILRKATLRLPQDKENTCDILS